MNNYRLYNDGAPWRKAPCLGCQQVISATRDAHVLFAGRRDGSSLLCIGLEPWAVISTNIKALNNAGDHFLLGLAHRDCVDRARLALEKRQVRLPANLPVLSIERLRELPFLFNQPPPNDMCPFCGEADNLSEEDIYPKWMEREFLRIIGPKERSPFHTSVGDNIRKHRKIGITAPCCQNCNNRWLSVIENDVKPVLLPLVFRHQEQAQLDIPSQVLLSTWAVKVALMMELYTKSTSEIENADPFIPIIPVGLYFDLRWRRTPHPSNTVVFIGAYSGKSSVLKSARSIYHIGIPEKQKPNALLSTFTAGSVLFQVAMFFGQSKVYLPDSVWANGLQNIWPVQSTDVQWPKNSLAYDDKAFAVIAEREIKMMDENIEP